MLRRTFVQTPLAAFVPARRYRAAIIGHTGRGNYGHDWEKAFTGLLNVEVVAVADPVEQGRQAALKSSGAARGYADYREMLRTEKPDLAAICPRWLDQRMEMFTAAMEAGAHVLMEKPFARTLEEADRMVALASRHGRKVQVGHTARPMPLTLAARDKLRAGEIGQLLELRSRGKEDRRAGGEDMAVLGTHVFDLLRFCAGDPRWVFAQVTQDGRPITRQSGRQAGEPVGPIAGDNIAAMFGFDNGVCGYFGSRLSDDRSGARFGVTLHGSKGLLFIPLSNVPGDPPYILKSPSWVGPPTGPPQTQTLNRVEVNRLMARDLIEAIEQNREPVCSADDGRWAIEMVTGVYQSAIFARRVEFPLQDRRNPLGA